MNNSSTPGPWQYDPVWSLITGPQGPEQQIAAIHGSDLVPKRQAQANARLIAASPDLLAAAIAISESVPCQSDHCRHYGLAHGKPCDVEAIRMIRNAISKATRE